MEKEIIKGYKGFDKDLKCRGFQYETGKEYSTDKAVACKTGFHYCENPMDVLGFYLPCDGSGNLNRFCEVEGSGDFDKSESDKLCCTHLKVKAEIGLNGLIKAGVQFILSRVKWKDDKDANTGDRSVASVDGKDSVAIVTGKDSKAKGALGCWIVLTERDSWNGETYPIKDVKAFKVDGKKIKADTWYKLVYSEPVEVRED